MPYLFIAEDEEGKKLEIQRTKLQNYLLPL